MSTDRIRRRFGVEFPLARGEQALKPKTWHIMEDVEPIYRFDRHTVELSRCMADEVGRHRGHGGA